MVLVVSRHVEVDRAFADVGEARIEDLLRQGDLLEDVPRGLWLDAGGQDAELGHRLVVAREVVLHDLHGLELLEACLLGDLVFARVGIVLQMTHVSDVAHVAHLIAEVTEEAEEDVEGDGGAGVS